MTPRTVISFVLSIAIVAASCGDDDSSAATVPATSPAPAAPGAPEPSVSTAPDAVFPVTIEHKFGETTIEAEPETIVSVGFGEHDVLLSLGVIPVGVRDWYGDQPYATWPWAQDALGDATPEVIAADALNFEQIAALEPDLILGISSGMSDTDYETLAAIAPTVAQPGEYPDFGTPIDEALLLAGRAVGREAEAEALLEELEADFAAVREQHPEFEGQTAAVAFAFEDLPGAYASADVRAEVMGRFGFVTPAEFDELAGDSFFFSVSQEELAVLDQDVIVWLATDASSYELLRAMPLRPSLTATQEGREVIADPLLTGAFSHASPLSLRFVIDELVPELALAVDGDPSTAVPSMLVLDEAGGAPSDEEQAASEAWSVVFDSTTSFDAKSAHLESADELRPTIESYAGVGSSMGGIRLDPVGVTIAGEEATVTYDVYFGEAAAYTALEGEMTLVDGVWTVSRDEFCSFMASARNPCP